MALSQLVYSFEYPVYRNQNSALLGRIVRFWTIGDNGGFRRAMVCPLLTLSGICFAPLNVRSASSAFLYVAHVQGQSATLPAQ
jgi:hypothetical protein